VFSIGYRSDIHGIRVSYIAGAEILFSSPWASILPGGPPGLYIPPYIFMM
jgi:hypothetical protein